MNPGYESVERIPSGLIACRVNGIQAHIMDLSPKSLRLRTPEPLPCEARLQLYFLQPETGEMIPRTIQSYQIGEAQREHGAVLSRLFFSDAGCAAAIRRTLNNYARYVEIRSEYGASAYGEELTAYPLDRDDTFYPTPDSQRTAWFKDLPPLSQRLGNASLALELNCPELWNMYIETPPGDLSRAYAALCRLPEGFLEGCRIDRLYLGNPHCRHLFPDADMLQRIAGKAEADGLSLTLTTAELRAGNEKNADTLLEFAAEKGLEVEINDWGMLERARAYSSGIALLLGTRLNRRRKDPRMQYKAGFAAHSHLLAQNSLNDPVWRQYLQEMGVVRFEYESCGLQTIPADGLCSLHLPFYQTNTSLWCPLQALCEHGDRGAQRPAASCPGWCENNILLYPAHLNLIGRWNSLLALDRSAWSTELPGSFDRLVLNF